MAQASGTSIVGRQLLISPPSNEQLFRIVLSGTGVLSGAAQKYYGFLSFEVAVLNQPNTQYDGVALWVPSVARNLSFLTVGQGRRIHAYWQFGGLNWTVFTSQV